jgi:hypothetical protein
MAKQRKPEARERLDEFEKELKGQPAPKIESNVKLDKSDLLGPKVSDASVRERVQRVYDDPNAVIIRETLR